MSKRKSTQEPYFQDEIDSYRFENGFLSYLMSCQCGTIALSIPSGKTLQTSRELKKEYLLMKNRLFPQKNCDLYPSAILSFFSELLEII